MTKNAKNLLELESLAEQLKAIAPAAKSLAADPDFRAGFVSTLEKIEVSFLAMLHHYSGATDGLRSPAADEAAATARALDIDPAGKAPALAPAADPSADHLKPAIDTRKPVKNHLTGRFE